jgi:hypothetical protein
MTDIEVLGEEPAELDDAEEEEKEEWREQCKLNQTGPAFFVGASNVFRSTCRTIGSENLHHLVIAGISRKGTSSLGVPRIVAQAVVEVPITQR